MARKRHVLLKSVFTKEDIETIKKHVKRDCDIKNIAHLLRFCPKAVKRAYRRHHMALLRPNYCYERDVYLSASYSF